MEIGTNRTYVRITDRDVDWPGWHAPHRIRGAEMPDVTPDLMNCVFLKICTVSLFSELIKEGARPCDFRPSGPRR